MLSTESSAFSTLEAFIAYISTQFHTQVQVIRSSNSSKFRDQYALAFYKRQGIIHHISYVDTPQQNGIVERKHKHLLEVARALLFQTKAPTTFSGDCVLTETYLINRLPNSTIGYKTPYEMLFNTKPTYEHLRNFGCLCYISALKHGRAKFKPALSLVYS